MFVVLVKNFIMESVEQDSALSRFNIHKCDFPSSSFFHHSSLRCFSQITSFTVSSAYILSWTRTLVSKIDYKWLEYGLSLIDFCPFKIKQITGNLESRFSW